MSAQSQALDFIVFEQTDHPIEPTMHVVGIDVALFDGSQAVIELIKASNDLDGIGLRVEFSLDLLEPLIHISGELI